MLDKNAQSTIEYLIAMTVIIAVCLIMIPKVVKKYKQALNKTARDINIMADRLTDSHNTTESNGHGNGHGK